jgi:dihydroflavonol-4-reductase
MKKVLVTGATGFIGLHCIKQLLEKGVTVRGTIRSKKREAEVIQAIRNCGLDTQNLELVETNLLHDDGWLEAMEGCDHVLHVASPNYDPDKEDIVKIAVEGTKRVLWAASQSDIRKMVMTSSLAAVTGCSEEEKEFNENDWADIEDQRIDPYTKSKIASELAAWDFIDNLPQSEKIQFSVIIPSAVSGPTLTDDIGTSNQFIFKLINGTTKGIVNLNIGWTDVRDVARAHIEALELNILDGERVILCERTLWVKEIVNKLKREGFKDLPRFSWPNFLMKFLSFDKKASIDIRMIGKQRIISNSKAKEIFPWNQKNALDSIVETAKQLNKLK